MNTKTKNMPQATVTALSHDGRGIATVQQKKTFINGALPGEIVTYQTTKKHSTYDTAQVLDIIEPAKERAVPPCQHFGLCGGCSLQYMKMDLQLSIKQQTLLEQLRHFGQVVPETILPPLNALELGYRRKARLGVKFVIKKNKLLVGFREKSSRYLADLESCAVLHPAVGKRLTELSQLVLSLQQYRAIPQIEVAIGDYDIALIFRHLETLSDQDREQLRIFGEQQQFHIYLQPNSPAPVEKIWPTNCKDRITYTLPDEQLEFLFHPLDFTQINLEMNRAMVRQAMDLLAVEPQETVLDLFCGIGNFSLPLARRAKFVTGIEGSQEMVERAYENAQHNHITNIEFAACNLMQPLTNAAWITKQYNKILLDPPRAGAQEILPFFNNFAAERIVYVSCNPATLARDAGLLVHQYGYQLKQAGIMNMFPHTSHIEAMAMFERTS